MVYELKLTFYVDNVKSRKYLIHFYKKNLMSFNQKVIAKQMSDDKHLCIGLDSEKSKIPSHIKSDKIDSQYIFNMEIIGATADIAAAYKPNFAFYLRYGRNGLYALEETVKYIRSQKKDNLIILDAKWGDIDNTNNGYVEYAYGILGVDAITIAPYMGGIANQPFLADPEKGSFILCATSNKGAHEFQDSKASEYFKPYERVAINVRKDWNKAKNCGLVTGATQPEETIANIRKLSDDDIPFLVPGIGAQGGDLEKAVIAAKNRNGVGFFINSSRGIIFASSGTDFAEVARKEAQKLHDEILSAKQ